MTVSVVAEDITAISTLGCDVTPSQTKVKRKMPPSPNTSNARFENVALNEGM